jgi:hypothetical protein
MVAVSVFPSLVAVIVAVPLARPVTTPSGETMANLLLFVVHVITRPARILPFASAVIAVSVTVPPGAIVAEDGVTDTLATGARSVPCDAVTVTVEVPVLPSLVAVMVTVPTATPVTTPLEDTVAFVGSLDVQVTTRPVRTFPPASFVVAVRGVVAPTATLAVVGATVTVATGGGVTVMVDVPVFPSHVAVMIADPVATPVTTPVEETVAFV